MKDFSLIVAVAANRAIGKDNALLWHLPEDLKYFKQVTAGHAVIMGRKTWESLPEKFRPLPGRRNIVVTRNAAYTAPGAELAASLEEALAQVSDDAEPFVIGGAELYRQALPTAQRLYITEVAVSPEADAFFPDIPAVFRETSRSRHQSVSGIDYAFVTYERIPQ